MATPPKVAGEVLHTVPEVADMWRCSDDTVYRLIAAGKLRSCDIGTGRAKTRVPASALAEFVAGRSRKTRVAS